jgi:hypothetical protein
MYSYVSCPHVFYMNIAISVNRGREADVIYVQSLISMLCLTYGIGYKSDNS